MIERRKAIIGALLLALVTGLTGYVWGQNGGLPGFDGLPGSPQGNQNGGLQPPTISDLPYEPAQWGELEAVRHAVKTGFIDEVEDEVLIQGAIDGLLRATGDPYTVYFTPEKYEVFLEHLQANFSGIGVFVNTIDGYLTITKPMENSPGAEAGLLPGDKVIAVDDQDITELSQDEAVSMIRGPEGTQVKLGILRGEEVLEFVITRAIIPYPSVSHAMIEGTKVGHLVLNEFNQDANLAVKSAIDELLAQGAESIIFDLRSNPGGLLSEAVKVAEIFIPPGPAVHTVDRNGNKKTDHAKERYYDGPLVVLINEGSASAAEIVAGTIKDYKAGTLMGMKTYGKGSVQSFYTLADGSGIKLTTARWLTGGGNAIDGVGVEPDIEVPMPLDQWRPGDPDVQLEKAVEFLTK